MSAAEPLVVHCLQHAERVRPLSVAQWADARGVELRVTRLDLDPLPDPTQVERLVVLGGGMNTDEADEHPWLDAEREFLRRVLEQGTARVLGICLGSQLLAEVLGASVGRTDTPEIGWQRVRLTDAGRASHVFSALPDEFDAFEWHGDAWTVPRAAELTITSDGCAFQGFAAGPRVSAVQFHPEFTYARTAQLAASTTDDLTRGGYVQPPDVFLADPARFDSLRVICDTLLDQSLLAPLPD